MQTLPQARLTILAMSIRDILALLYLGAVIVLTTLALVELVARIQFGNGIKNVKASMNTMLLQQLKRNAPVASDVDRALNAIEGIETDMIILSETGGGKLLTVKGLSVMLRRTQRNLALDLEARGEITNTVSNSTEENAEERKQTPQVGENAESPKANGEEDPKATPKNDDSAANQKEPEPETITPAEIDDPRFPLLADEDFTDSYGFVIKLRVHSKPLTAYIWETLPSEARSVLIDQRLPHEKHGIMLRRELNRIILGGSLYDKARVANLTLSKKTLALIDDENIPLFNRAILEDAYPHELAKNATVQEQHKIEDQQMRHQVIDEEPAGWFYNPFNQMPSESILASALIGSGLLGTLLAIIRHKSKPAPRELLSIGHLVSGISAGFVTFLAIRGGKSVFLMTFTTEVVQINPYTASFTAFLVGLFTDKAYVSLSNVVDRVIKRAETEATRSKSKVDADAGMSTKQRTRGKAKE